jgi:Tfp pilus assembly protein PilV
MDGSSLKLVRVPPSSSDLGVRRISKTPPNKFEGGTRATRGFTLLETIAALFVLTVGLFAVFQMYLFGLDKLHALNERETALLAIQNEVEALRAQPFEALSDLEEGPFISVTPGFEKLHLARGLVTIETITAIKGDSHHLVLEGARSSDAAAPGNGVTDGSSAPSTLKGDCPLLLKRLTVRVVWIGENGRRIEKETVTLVTDTD